MELEKTVEIGLLLDTYGDLLTKRMKDILTMYVCENLSLQEIGDFFKISKPAVLDAIKTSIKKLELFEQKVKMLSFKNSVKKLLEKSVVTKVNLQKLLDEF